MMGLLVCPPCLQSGAGGIYPLISQGCMDSVCTLCQLFLLYNWSGMISAPLEPQISKILSYYKLLEIVF